MEPVELSMKWKSLLESNKFDVLIAYGEIYPLIFFIKYPS